MYEDDLVAALNQAVKQEIIENYVRERRIVEEEIALLCETASALHGGLAAWEKRKLNLARALVNPGVGERFFRLAGLGDLPSLPPTPPPALCRLPRGWTRRQRYTALVRQIYTAIWQQAGELAKEREKVLALRQEVNEDILSFERNHDMLTITTFLRSLDAAELQRRKILGVNFSARETAISAANLSFQIVSLERLGLHPDLGRELLRPRPAAEVLSEAREMLRALCHSNPCEVDALWSAGSLASGAKDLPALEEI